MIFAIVGPTASGKSALGVQVAKAVGGSVISCDSVQVYKGFDIGSGKLTQAEREGVPHYLLDIRDAREGFTAGEFRSLAEEAVMEIQRDGRIPILVGGTGLYYRAFAYQYALREKSPEEEAVRLALIREMEEKGSPALHQRLAALDPEGASLVDPRHSSRVLRALTFTICHQEGIQIQEEESGGLRPDLYGILLETDRPLLYERIGNRVLEMLERGLLDEVKRLHDKGIPWDAAPMQTIGYKEAGAFFRGELSYEEMVEAISRHTRNYAKRQVTWFRRHEELLRLSMNAPEDMEKAVRYFRNLADNR